MNKLTEQQLQKIANPGENDIGGTQSPIVTQMAAELLKARAELAAIKGAQQPFGYVCSMSERDLWKGHSCPLYPSVDEDAGYDIPVYLHPAPAVASRFKLIPQNPSLAMLTVLGLTGSFESMTEKYHKMLALAQATSGDID